MITYLEHYPHYMGTMNTTAKITEENFALLLTLVADQSKEAKELFEYEFEGFEEFLASPRPKSGPYALEAAIEDHDTNAPDAAAKRVKQILRALSTKGYWAGYWEEGTHAFALPGFEKEAVSAIAKLEAQITEDTFIF
jgi:hypothetical protein